MTEQDFQLPDLNFETKAQESEPYLGIIVSSEISRSVFNGEKQTQWVYMVRPVRLQMKSKTGLFYGYIKIPDGVPGERSVLMRTFKEFTRVFGSRDENGELRGLVADGHDISDRLVGLVAWFQQKSYSFGKGMNDSKPAPTPVSRATAEEWAEAQALPAIKIPDVHRRDDAAAAPEAIRNEIDLSDETVVGLVLGMYDGRTRAQVAKRAMTNADLDDNVRKDLISGAFLNALIEAGRAKINDDNTVSVLSLVEAQ